MHDEFMLQYQLPILKRFALTAYGCCEDLTTKIGILRQIPNLRIIGVAPRADLRKCAAQIGTDYVISWRPNPTNMVCSGFDEAQIRRIIREGLSICKGLHLHLHLKDIETVEGQPDRLARWARIVRDEIEILSRTPGNRSAGGPERGRAPAVTPAAVRALSTCRPASCRASARPWGGGPG
jgi:hypothetical protein